MSHHSFVVFGARKSFQAVLSPFGLSIIPPMYWKYNYTRACPDCLRQLDPQGRHSSHRPSPDYSAATTNDRIG